MIVLVLSLSLWGVVVILSYLAYQRGIMREGLHMGVQDFISLIPRLIIGVVGSGFIAALLPQEQVQRYLGENSGAIGFMIAYIAGALTTGGPVIGYTLGASALKSGASLPVVMVFVTSWCVFTLQRFFVYELGLLSRELSWVRHLTSLPLPLCAGLIFIVCAPYLKF